MNFLEQIKLIINEDNFGFVDYSIVKEKIINDFESIQHEHILPISRKLGKLFIEQELYSQDEDFTHTWVKKENHEHKSYLKRLWAGDENLSHHERVQCWTLLHQDKPIGVAVFEIPDESCETIDGQDYLEIGSFSVYLKPAYRGKGLVKQWIEKEITPFIQNLMLPYLKAGFHCYIGAEDAAGKLLQQQHLNCQIIPFHHRTIERTDFLKAQNQSKKQKFKK